jgi:TonB-dependent receptor
MSRKTLRNASKHAFKKNAGLGALGRSAYAKIGLSGLALGSMTLAAQGVAHAATASAGAGSDQPAVPGVAAKSKRRGLRATPMASTGMFARNGAGLFAMNTGPVQSAAGSTTIQAAANSATELQPIVVTGIRGSLMRSLQIKKASIGVVDAISAEQIGQFPDATIGGAISRIPGVTVNRGTINGSGANSTGAPTATGQVQGITVNGFGGSFNKVLVEGRQIASGNGQTFNFSDFSAVYVGEVDVYKTPDMSLSGGAIGATINVKFPNPFDKPGMHSQMQISENDSSLDGGFRPSFGALWSDTFDHNKFGILVDGDYMDSHILGHHQDVVGWKGNKSFPCSDLAANYTTAFGSTGCSSVGAGATGNSQVPVWYPQEMNMWLERTDSRRKDGRVSLQWHPVDSVMVTVDDNYSSDSEHRTSWNRSTWFGAFPNATLDSNGTITNFNYNGPTDFNGVVDTSYITTNTTGLNVLWDASDAWTLELDADHSVSQFNPNGGYSNIGSDIGFGNTSANNYTGGLALSTNSNVLPYWSAYGPGAVASGSSAVASPNYNGLNPYILGSHVMVIQDQRNNDQVNEAQLAATWHKDSTRVKFGAQFIDDDWNSKEMDTFTNNYWELWSGYGTSPGNGVSIPSSLISTANITPWMNGFSGASNLPSSLLMYSPYSVLGYLEGQPVNPSANATAVADGYPAYAGGVPALALSPTSVQHVARMNYDPFVTVDHNFPIGDMTLKVGLGLRYDRTEETIAGLQAPLEQVIWGGSGDPTAYSFKLGAPTWTQTTNSFGYFLPSLDLNLMVTQDLKLRADFSRTESQPPNGQLIPNTSYGGRVNAFTATGNNPNLMPYLSDNFNLGAEWYYGNNDYASIEGFLKRVTNFPTSSVSSVQVPGITDPAPCTYNGAPLSNSCGQTVTFAETTYTNQLSATVTGVSVAWQQMLKWGFGFLINGTYAHSNANFNTYSTTSNQFALPGVGNSANLIAFYQKHGIQARLALQWQASELLGLGQEQSGGAFGNEPVYLASSTELDFSTNYAINKHLTAYFEALNLTDAVYHTYGRFKNQTLNLVDYGRSYTIGLRANF